jgi:asparagine synthetase B (glutamine-hydrolysing)
MDSSAIAVILSRIFPKNQLHTYSFVLNDHTASFSDSGIDEKGTQEEVIQYADLKRDNHHQITGFHYQDVFEELETRNQVMGGLANSDAIWQDSLFKQAAEIDKVEVMFSGFPGDEGISCQGGNYYYEYIYHKDIKGIIKHLLKFRRSAIRGVYNYFRFKKLGTTMPSFSSIQKIRSTLNPYLEKEFNLKDSSFEFKPSFKEWFKSQITRQNICLRTESEGAYANRHGIDTVYPMADLRLIQLVYSLPVHLFAPKPYSRALFRNICKGILPEKVRTQPKFSGAKTLAFADYWIKTKYQQLQNFRIKNALNLFISEEEYDKRQHESELMGIKRLNHLKEMDYLLEKNL